MRKQLSPKKTLLDRLLSGMKIFVGIVVTGGGFLIALYTFVLPLVSVVSSDAPLNPSDVFSTPFTVSHVGALPIQKVKVFCYLNHIGDKGKYIEQNTEEGIPGGNVDTLGIGQQTSIICPLYVKGVEVTSADIIIIVCYHPWHIPWQKHQLQRFIAMEKSDGTLRWYPYQLIETLFELSSICKS